MDVLEYKGYVTKVHYDVETKKLYGKVQGIVDAVNYESDTIDGVEAAFHDSVDRYLAFCAAVKRRPCKAFKGQFNVRMKPAMHKAMAVWAMEHDITLNAAMEEAVRTFLTENETAASIPTPPTSCS